MSNDSYICISTFKGREDGKNVVTAVNCGREEDVTTISRTGDRLGH